MRFLATLLSLLLAGNLAFADETTNGGTEAKSQGPNSVPNADTVDQILTNPQMRAASGSKSRWSISNSIGYSGGSVSSPFAEGRPNIANASAISIDTEISDQISIKYSIDPVDSVLFGVGMRKMAPFTGSGPSAKFYAQGGKDVDVYDPVLSFQHVYRFIGIQAILQFGYLQYTRDDIHSANYGNLNQNIYLDQETIYEIGRFSIGGSVGISLNTATDPAVDYSEYQYWFDPYAEFRLNKAFNIRIATDPWNYEYYPMAKLVRDTFTASLGLGCSITRDFFLYPNIQFLPEKISKDYTNVGLGATINLF